MPRQEAILSLLSQYREQFGGKRTDDRRLAVELGLSPAQWAVFAAGETFSSQQRDRTLRRMAMALEMAQQGSSISREFSQNRFYCDLVGLKFGKTAERQYPLYGGLLKAIEAIPPQKDWWTAFETTPRELKIVSLRRMNGMVDLAFDSAVAAGVINLAPKPSSSQFPPSLYKTKQRIIILKALLYSANGCPMNMQEVVDMGLEEEGKRRFPSKVSLLAVAGLEEQFEPCSEKSVQSFF